MTAADVQVKLDGQAGVGEGLMGVGEGFGFDAVAQRGQVSCLCGGDAEHDLRVGSVTDHPAFRVIDAVRSHLFRARRTLGTKLREWR